MDDLRIFLTEPDPSNPLWWAAVATGLIAMAKLWDVVYPRVDAFAKSTATKLDDRIVAALRPVGGLLRRAAAVIRAGLPLAKLRLDGDAYKDAYGEDDRGESAL